MKRSERLAKEGKIEVNICNFAIAKVITAEQIFKPSIDRIDSSKGYTINNVRICWMIENLCKNTFTDDDVIEFCKRKLNLL